MRKALLDSFIWRGIHFISIAILNILVARYYEAAQSGQIYFITNNFYFVLLVGNLSLDSSMTYFSSGKKLPSEKLASFSLSWPFVVTFFSMVCTSFLIMNHQIRGTKTFLLFAGTTYALGVSLTNFFNSLFYARQQFAIPSIYLSVVNIIVILLLPFFAAGHFGLNREIFLYVYFFQFIVQGAGLVWLYFTYYPQKGLWQYPGLKEIKMIFGYAFVALSANIAYYLINRVDYFFVAAWCSPKSLGNYVQVSKMGQLLLIIPTIISGAVYPLASAGEKVEMIKPIVKMTGVFVLLYIGIIAVSYLYSNKIFIWLFGKTYDEMFVPFLIFLPAIFFLSIHIIIAAYFGGKNNVFYNVASTAAGLTVVVVGDILLIKKMGIEGAAIASLLGYGTTFMVSMILFIKKTGTSPSEFFSPGLFRPATYAALFKSKSANTV